MIQAYKNVSIIYGGHGRKYADALNERILKLSEEKRYPIKPTIINERILTCELLAEVTSLFKGSEFCVAFLTEDDFSINKDGRKTQRLRQNVVFELGMALIEIGRERCILLSDFDPNKADFELPSDMHSLEIKRFDEDSFDSVCGSVIEKLLSFSKSSINYGTTSDDIPCYNNLFRRDEYLIDYENIFSNRPDSLATEGWDFYKDTLKYSGKLLKSVTPNDEGRPLLSFEYNDKGQLVKVREITHDPHQNTVVVITNTSTGDVKSIYRTGIEADDTYTFSR